MSAKKIQSTKDYRLFTRHSNENRPVNLKKHRALLESMKVYGFLDCFPIVCVRDEKGNLVVKDGQHRLAFAEALGLPVHYVVDDGKWDVAKTNIATKTWVVRDYAEKYAANGMSHYQEAIDFSEKYGLPIGVSASLLAGTTSFTNISDQFNNGLWKIKDRDWAEAVAGIFVPLVRIAPAINNARLIAACMSVCRVEGFDADRLLANASRCRDKLVPYATRESYLLMLEEVYNHGRQKLVGLKAAATEAMRERNPGAQNGNGVHHGKKIAKYQATA